MAKTLTKDEKDDFHKKLAEIKKVFDEKRKAMSAMTYVPSKEDYELGGFKLFNGWVTVRFESDYNIGPYTYTATITVFLDDKKETAYVWRDSVTLEDPRMDKYAQSRLVFNLVKEHVSVTHLETAMHRSEHYDQMKFLTDRAERKKVEFDDECIYKKAYFGIAVGGLSTVGLVDTTTAPTSSTLHVTTPTGSVGGTVKTPPE